MPDPVFTQPETRKYHHGDLRRVLIEAALSLIAEEQGWSFSLREVARRAGVSHNAPSRHFADKSDLLAALAVAGYDALTDALRPAGADRTPAAALIAIGVAYVAFATDNATHYRLMFGPELRLRTGELPADVADAAARAKAVLAEVIAAGARSGDFDVAADNPPALDLAVLSAWAIVHGLSMLQIDGLAPDASASTAESVTHALLNGLQSR